MPKYKVERSESWSGKEEYTVKEEMTGAEAAGAVIGGLVLMNQRNKNAEAQRLHERIVKSIEQGDYRQGVEVATTLLKKFRKWPGIENVYQARAYCYRELGEFDEALSDVDRALSIAPDDIDSYSVRIGVYYEQGDLAKAISDATEIVKRKPSDDDAFAARANLLHEVGNYEGAMADVSKAISIHPGNPEYFLLKGLILRDQGQIEDALEAVRGALSLDPQSVGGLKLRGKLHLESANYQGAVDDLTRAIEMHPPDSALLESRAEAYEGLGSMDLATADRKQAEFAGRVREMYRSYRDTSKELYDAGNKRVYTSSDLTPPTSKAQSAGCLVVGGIGSMITALFGFSESDLSCLLLSGALLALAGWVAYHTSVVAPKQHAAAAKEYLLVISDHERDYPHIGGFFEQYLEARKSGELGELFSRTWHLFEGEVRDSAEDSST